MLEHIMLIAGQNRPHPRCPEEAGAQTLRTAVPAAAAALSPAAFATSKSPTATSTFYIVTALSSLSRYPEEADAQTLRTAVLLDELDFPGNGQPDPRTGNIVVELKTANAMPLLRYSCSSRIISLPTAQLNARRCERSLSSLMKPAEPCPSTGGSPMKKFSMSAACATC